MMERLRSKVQALLGSGTLKGTTASGPVLTAQVAISPYEVRDNVPVLGLAGVVSHPLPGSDVMLMFPGGNRGNAVIVAHNHRAYFKRGSRPGDLGFTHHQGWSVLLTPDGIVVDGGGGPVTIRNASKTRIEGDLEVTGEVTARADGAAVHLTLHTHVAPSGGNTSKASG